MGTFTDSDDQDEMRHNVAFYQGLQFVKVKLNTKKYYRFF